MLYCYYCYIIFRLLCEKYKSLDKATGVRVILNEIKTFALFSSRGVWIQITQNRRSTYFFNCRMISRTIQLSPFPFHVSLQFFLTTTIVGFNQYPFVNIIKRKNLDSNTFTMTRWWNYVLKSKYMIFTDCWLWNKRFINLWCIRKKR